MRSANVPHLRDARRELICFGVAVGFVLVTVAAGLVAAFWLLRGLV